MSNADARKHYLYRLVMDSMQTRPDSRQRFNRSFGPWFLKKQQLIEAGEHMIALDKRLVRLYVEMVPSDREFTESEIIRVDYFEFKESQGNVPVPQQSRQSSPKLSHPDH